MPLTAAANFVCFVLPSDIFQTKYFCLLFPPQHTERQTENNANGLFDLTPHAVDVLGSAQKLLNYILFHKTVSCLPLGCGFGISDSDTFKYELWISCLYGEKFKKQEKAPVG
jgi:hypothetical protein